MFCVPFTNGSNPNESTKSPTQPTESTKYTPDRPPNANPHVVLTDFGPTATGGSCGARHLCTGELRFGICALKMHTAGIRSRTKSSFLTCRFFAARAANCQPGGRTRAATRMAGLSGAHVSEGNAESCNPILTRLHIAERTEQPPVPRSQRRKFTLSGNGRVVYS